MTNMQGFTSGSRSRRSVKNDPMRYRLPEVTEIKKAIIDKGLLESFCREFLKGGRKDGKFWRCGAIDGSAGDSFTMRLYGPEAGLGYDWALKKSYDIIDGIEASAGMTLNEALATARHRLAMPIEEFADYTPREKTAAEIDAEAEKKRKGIADALKIWNETSDIIGTDAEAYLRMRGIDQALPVSLRFHPKLGYWDNGAEGKPVFVGNFPALVCMVQRADGSFCGVQRIYLAPGGVGKAPVRAPKKARGDILGGAVRCCDDEDIRGELGICEGIEDALSIPGLYDGKPAWAAVSARGIAGVELPAWVTHPVFFPDNDPPQRKKNGDIALNKYGKPIYPGPDACAEAASRLKSETCHPRISLIRGGKDANAVLMAENGLVL
jgi:hypothetical protein